MNNKFKYRVVIPTAGLGTRLKTTSKHINKALVSIGNKPSISHIVEKFPESVEIVVALGYKKESVRDFLTIAYPRRRFIFVEIDPFEGEGAGLGLSLLKCREHLQLPFVFCSNDTLVSEAIPLPSENWMGYADSTDTEQYRSVRLDENSQVIEICSKGASGNVRPYIGLAGVRDHKRFWEAMEAGRDQGAIAIGESYGLRFLIDNGIKAKCFQWHDTGNVEALARSRTAFEIAGGPNILEKEEEAIWFVENKVIKFAVDNRFISSRVERAKHLANFIPQIEATAPNMYVYRKVDGEELAKQPTVATFEYFLDWMTGFWQPASLDSTAREEFRAACDVFYREKTLKRVTQYFTRFEQIDAEEIINGTIVPRLRAIFERIDWARLSDGLPVRFHGDLHFENILIRNDGHPPFCLLDWRQDFGGKLEYGDIYYDFAKLLHGLIISHELVHLKRFSVNQRLNRIDYDFHRKNSLVECEEVLRRYVEKNEYDWNRVQLLTALIFINIAPLHHYPYTKLLFYLGKTMLHRHCAHVRTNV